MRTLRWLFTLILLAAMMKGLTSCGLSTPALTPDQKVVAEGNTKFALDLYAKLKDRKGNLFSSPYSISTALAMTYGGARGETAKQMANVLHFTLEQKRLHPAFAGLQGQLKAAQKTGRVELSVANALWAQKDYTFLKEFLNLTEERYGAGLKKVDFKNAIEAARQEINAWVEQETKERIKNLIPPRVIDALTRLVLTNAIYFKGAWVTKFKKDATQQQRFWTTPDKSINVPMMREVAKFRYLDETDLQVLELPYAGHRLSMTVLLPRRRDGLPELEAKLSASSVNAWIGRLWKQEVMVLLPRFRMTSQFDLAKTLGSMGMQDAFGPGVADFSGMDGSKTLYLSAVLHKAFVDVNEEGTEAAAATAPVVQTLEGGRPSPVFLADHPFLFLIRHNPSGSILFMGRVVNPKEQ